MVAHCNGWLSCRQPESLACGKTSALRLVVVAVAFLCFCGAFWFSAGREVEEDHDTGTPVVGGGTSALTTSEQRRWMFLATTVSREVVIGLPERRCTCGTSRGCACESAAKLRMGSPPPSVRDLVQDTVHPKQRRTPDCIIVSFHHRVLDKSLENVLSSPEVFERRRVDRRSWDVSLKFEYLLTLATWNHLIYALAHGLPLLHVYGAFPDLEAHRQRRVEDRQRLLGARSVDLQPHWYKYFLLELVLQSAATPLSWVFWVDMDALFMNVGLDPAHVLDVPLSTAGDVTVTSAMRRTRCAILWSSGAQERLNNGVGFFRTRNDAANASIAEKVIAGVWNTVTRQHIGGSADNSATLFYLRKKATVAERDAVCVVPRHEMNAFPTELVSKRDQRNLVLLGASCGEDIKGARVPFSSCREAYAATRGFYRNDDWIVHFPGLRARKAVAIFYFCRALDHPFTTSRNWFTLNAFAEERWTESSQTRNQNASVVQASCKHNLAALQRTFRSFSHLRR